MTVKLMNGMDKDKNKNKNKERNNFIITVSAIDCMIVIY